MTAVLVAALSLMTGATFSQAAAPAQPIYQTYFRSHYCPSRNEKTGSNRIEPTSEMRKLVDEIDDVYLSEPTKKIVDAEIKKFGFTNVDDLHLSAIQISSSSKNDLWSIVEARFTGKGTDSGKTIFRQCSLDLIFPADVRGHTDVHFDLNRNCQQPRPEPTFDPMEGPISMASVFDVADIPRQGRNDFVLQVVQPYGSELVAYHPSKSGWKEVFRGCGQGE